MPGTDLTSNQGRSVITAAAPDEAADAPPYELKISRLTIDKLGVKLYDKASAVVAELVANGYDADAERVMVRIPLSVQLASRVDGELEDRTEAIEVIDNGHGMTPEEAAAFYLRVGADRRKRPDGGRRSRHKGRPVMGRKGIGKLSPFGICRRIEVWSAGGEQTEAGFKITHFYMDFDRIVADDDEHVPLEKGSDDRGWSPVSGTRIRLTRFLAKRVPDEETFIRQLAVRFTFARPDFRIEVVDISPAARPARVVTPLDIPLLEGTKIDVAARPVVLDGGEVLSVKGWVGMARDAYKNEEMAGVRIYAREKIVGTTRDFNQPAGFTGEFTMRSYLVGMVEAEWLDEDDGEDLVRTDRQDILWDSDLGQALRRWGADLIREVARRSRQPRREKARDTFMTRSNFAKRARERFGDRDIAAAAIELAEQFGGFAAEDELDDEVYVDDLSEIILSVAPHRALMEAFKSFSARVSNADVTIEELADIFDKTQLAELASYAQVAHERVRVINELAGVVRGSFDESEFQRLLAMAPWLISPSWTVISVNQSLKTFKGAFQNYWKRKTGQDLELAISFESKKPDFTLISLEGFLHIVEIKRSNYDFSDDDCTRLLNYVTAFEDFFHEHPAIASNFSRGWRIDLIADGTAIKDNGLKRAFSAAVKDGHVRQMPWEDFLNNAVKVHEQFLEISQTVGRGQPKLAAPSSAGKGV